MAEHVPRQAATPVAAGDTPPLPAPPFRLEAIGCAWPISFGRASPSATHGRTSGLPSGTRGRSPWMGVQVRLCAGGAQQCAFLPRQRGDRGNPAPPTAIEQTTPYSTRLRWRRGRTTGPHGRPSGDADGSPVRRRRADTPPLEANQDALKPSRRRAPGSIPVKADRTGSCQRRGFRREHRRNPARGSCLPNRQCRSCMRVRPQG